MLKRFSFISAAVVVFSFTFALKSAQAIECGDTILLESQEVMLDTNLFCFSNPALTVIGPGTFDMNGHKIACALPNLTDGLVIEGKKATVKNGVVINCDDGVEIRGEGQHRVESIVARGNVEGLQAHSLQNTIKSVTVIDSGGTGIRVLGKKNTFDSCHTVGNAFSGFFVQVSGNHVFKRNMAYDNGSAGFEIYGSGQRVDDNIAIDNVRQGYVLSGSKHKVNRNLAASNSLEGFEIVGTQQIVKDNIATNNASHGFRVAVSFHTLLRNRSTTNLERGIEMVGLLSSFSKTVALGNGDVDLFDSLTACGSNDWSQNIFGTSQASNVLQPDCIQ